MLVVFFRHGPVDLRCTVLIYLYFHSEELVVGDLRGGLLQCLVGLDVVEQGERGGPWRQAVGGVGLVRLQTEGDGLRHLLPLGLPVPVILVHGGKLRRIEGELLLLDLAHIHRVAPCAVDDGRQCAVVRVDPLDVERVARGPDSAVEHAVPQGDGGCPLHLMGQVHGLDERLRLVIRLPERVRLHLVRVVAHRGYGIRPLEQKGVVEDQALVLGRTVKHVDAGIADVRLIGRRTLHVVHEVLFGVPGIARSGFRGLVVHVPQGIPQQLRKGEDPLKGFSLLPLRLGLSAGYGGRCLHALFFSHAYRSSPPSCVE